MPPPIPGALRCEHDKPLIAVNTLCYPNTYSELIIKCIDTNGLCPGFTLVSIRVALYIRTPNVMTNRLDMEGDDECVLLETNVPCEHTNSARRASPPLDDIQYWSGPQEKLDLHCGMCGKSVLDLNPPFFRECLKCGLWCCWECYYAE